MSGLDALEELQLNIQEALDEEAIRVSHESPRSRKAFTQKSVRDLGDLDTSAPEKISHSEVLVSWQALVQSLSAVQVFLQYTPALERFFNFSNVNMDDESDLVHIQTFLDLMAETVDNRDRDPSTKCRYVTLLELLTTYEPNWKASRQVMVLWDAEGHDLEPNISPDEFRQTAYGVLMSLSWVPNSRGLRQACNIDDEDSLEDEKVPLAVQSVFDQIRSRPLPRHDSIHRILSHLEDEDNATIAISSIVDEAFHGPSRRSQGLGKTTLAAMVAAMPQIQSKYDVLWVCLKHKDDDSNDMTYRTYISYLNALCEQLDLEHEWPKPTRRLEERALHQKRDEEKMFQIKYEMAQLLRENTVNLLLILDDVQDDQEIEWFRFLDHEALLVTTNAAGLSFTWTLELELLSEEEALQLFLTEAGYAPDDVLGTSLEVKSIVQRCGYHPLSIRTVARWFSLKEATAGVVKAVEELDQELSTCTAKLRHSRSSKSNPEYILLEVMNLTLSPVLTAAGHPTTLMKTCLSSAALVLDLPAPREAVMLLWEQLLRTEPAAVHELGHSMSSGKLRKRIGFIMEALSSLGLISISLKDGQSYVAIHNDTQLKYAKSLARELHFGDEKTATVERWHEAFAVAYINRKAESQRDGLEDSCRGYAIEKLIFHMVEAKMYAKAATLMKDDRFLADRFTMKGFEAGTQLLLRDCQKMQSKMEADGDQDKDGFEIIAAIYTQVAAFILSKAKEKSDEAVSDDGKAVHDTVRQAGKAVHDLGFALAEIGYSPEAILQYKSALKLVPKQSSVYAILLYGMGAVNMLRNAHTKGLKNLNECLKAMASNDISGSLYAEALLLKGDALVANCDYDGATELYQQSLEVFYADSTNNRVEIGIAICRKGLLLYTRGHLDDALRFLVDAIVLKLKIGENSADLARAYYFVGHIYAEQNQITLAIENFDKALSIMKANLDEVDAADIYLATGKLCELRDDFDGCLDAFDLALKEIREFPRLEMDRVVHDLRSIARVYASHGDYVGAMPIFEEGFELSEDRPNSLERASLLFDMGSCEIEQREYEEAAFHLKQCYKARKEKLDCGEVVVQTMEKLGAVYKLLGEPDEALSLYNKALESTEKTYGEDNAKVASILYLLGDIKESMGEQVEALANFEECLELRRRHLEITSFDIADTLEKIGAIYVEQGSSEKAYLCHAEALDIRQANSQSDDPVLGESFHRIGVVARKCGELERALHFLLDALHIRKMRRQQREMCSTLLEIGHVHRRSADTESALGCYEKCLWILHENFGESDPMASDVLLALGHVHRYAGDADKALACFEEALSLRTQEYSPDHVKVAPVYWGVGIAKFELDSYEEAMISLGDFVKIQDANKTKNVDYVIALQVMGDLHKYFDNGDEASTAWSTAFKVYSSSKDMVSKYPDLGPMLERRLVTATEESEAVPQGNFFVSLVSHLSEEVSKLDKLNRDPVEDEFRRTVYFET